MREGPRFTKLKDKADNIQSGKRYYRYFNKTKGTQLANATEKIRRTHNFKALEAAVKVLRWVSKLST